MRCPICGEQLVGDGYGLPRHCPDADLDDWWYEAPDCSPVLCATTNQDQEVVMGGRGGGLLGVGPPIEGRYEPAFTVVSDPSNKARPFKVQLHEGRMPARGMQVDPANARGFLADSKGRTRRFGSEGAARETAAREVGELAFIPRRGAGVPKAYK